LCRNILKKHGNVLLFSLQPSCGKAIKEVSIKKLIKIVTSKVDNIYNMVCSRAPNYPIAFATLIAAIYRQVTITIKCRLITHSQLYLLKSRNYQDSNAAHTHKQVAGQ